VIQPRETPVGGEAPPAGQSNAAAEESGVPYRRLPPCTVCWHAFSSHWTARKYRFRGCRVERCTCQRYYSD